MLQMPRPMTNLQAVQILAGKFGVTSTREALAEALRRLWGPDPDGIYQERLDADDRRLHEADELPGFAKLFLH